MRTWDMGKVRALALAAVASLSLAVLLAPPAVRADSPAWDRKLQTQLSQQQAQQAQAASSSQGSCLTKWTDPTQDPRYQAEWNNLGLADRFIVGLLNDFENAALALGFQDLPQLIFNAPDPCIKQSNQLSVWGIMTQSQFDYTIHPWERAFEALALSLVSLFILAAALKWFTMAAFDVGARIDFANWIYNWLIGILFTAAFLPIVGLIFWLNNSIVTDFAGMAQMPTSFLALMPSSNTGGIIGLVVIRLVGTGLVLMLNFFYLFRRFSLMFLVVIGPLVGGITWMDRRTQGIARTYWMELAIDILQQSIHATLLAMFFALYNTGVKHGGVGWLFILGFLVFLMPFSNMLRQMFGATAVGGRAGMIASALGMGSVAGVVALMGMAGNSMFGRGGVGALGAEAAMGMGGAMLAGGGGGTPGIPAAGGMESLFRDATAPGAVTSGISSARRWGGGALGAAAGVAGSLIGFGLGGPLGMAALGRVGGRVGSALGAGVAGGTSFAHQTARSVGAAYQSARQSGMSGWGALSHSVKGAFGGDKPWMGHSEAWQTVGANAMRTAAFAVGGAGLAQHGHVFGRWMGGAFSGEEPSFLETPGADLRDRLSTLGVGARIVEERHPDHTVARIGSADGEVIGFKPTPNVDVRGQPQYRVWEVQTPIGGHSMPQGAVQMESGNWLVPVSQFVDHAGVRVPTSFDGMLWRA